MPRLTYATRKSQLALAQCRAFVAELQRANPGLEATELLVTTTGDRIQDRPLSEVGGKGLFVKEIEEALLDRRADIAVHSVKDVPAVVPDGLVLGCLPRRVDPRDVLIAPKHGRLADLPHGARVGTSSLRRGLALREARSDLVLVPIRGNVDTRLRKADAGEVDAVVLAGAGLLRLGLESRVTEWLAPEVSLPAIGQGALGIELRAGDDATERLLAPLHDEETGRCVAAERGVMAVLGGDCKTPIAAYGIESGGTLWLRAFVADHDGSRLRRAEAKLPWPKSDEEARRVGWDLGESICT